MAIKRLAATTAAAVLLATPACGWTIHPPARPSGLAVRLRQGHAVIRSDGPTTSSSTSRYMAAAIVDGSSQEYQSADSTPGWHQRVLRKVFRRRRRRGLEMKGAAMTLQDAELQQQAMNLMGRPFDLTTNNRQQQQHQTMSLTLDLPSFGSAELESLSIPLADLDLCGTGISPSTTTVPTSLTLERDAMLASSVPATSLEQVLPDTNTIAAVSGSEGRNMAVASIDGTELSAAALPIIELVEPSTEGGSPFVRITRPWVQNILVGLLDRWSQGSHVNLNVNCHPQSKTIDLVQGRFACDASVDFDRIIFGPIRMHRGRIEVNRMTLGLWSLTPSSIPIRGHRYLNQFEFYGRNITFTKEDLVESRCIRNGLKNLLARILKLQGTKAVRISIDTIQILPNGKIACRGAAKTAFGKILEFEVRSGLGFTSRGHILTFPGLQISLSPLLGIFVPVLPAISLDLGHNAQLLDLNIDGQAGEMTMSARVTIAPHHTLKLRKYKQSREAYLAHYSVDVGRWLTRLGNFTS